jgi:hypothetical protein
VALNADLDIAERYLEAIRATVRLIELHPQVGAIRKFRPPAPKRLGLFVVFRPFNRHVLFHEIADGDLIIRGAVYGHRHFSM